eukprot:765588-Hanusia_phi.AAC.2
MKEEILKKHLISENDNINENHGDNRVAQPNENISADVMDDLIEQTSVLNLSDDGGEVSASSSSAFSLKCKFDKQVLEWDICPDGVTTDQRAAMGYGFTKTTIRWPQHMQLVDYKTPMQCWEIVFPWKYFLGQDRATGSCLLWTNDSLPDNVSPFTVYEFLQFIGVIYARSLAPDGRMRDLWSSKPHSMFRPPELGSRYNVSRRRFEMWQKYLRLCPPFYMESMNSFDQIRPLIDAFNENRKQSINAGTELLIDESMGKWIPRNEYTAEGIPHLTKIARKPMGVGCEYKNLAECTYGILLFLELQEGKEIMETKMYDIGCPKHTSLVMRLAQNYLDKGHAIYGDSAFASLSTAKTLFSRKTFFTGLVKQCSSGFPKRYLNEEAWDIMDHRGKTQTVSLKMDIDGMNFMIYGHAWNEPGRVNVPRKILISTWNTTEEASPHEKKRVRINGETRRTEHYTFNVPRTKMIKSYFTSASIIDVHNHLRQDSLGLENAIGTQNWRFRMMCTILGFIEVDAFKIYAECNRLKRAPIHRQFTETLSEDLVGMISRMGHPK